MILKHGADDQLYMYLWPQISLKDYLITSIITVIKFLQIIKGEQKFLMYVKMPIEEKYGQIRKLAALIQALQQVSWLSQSSSPGFNSQACSCLYGVLMHVLPVSSFLPPPKNKPVGELALL